MAYSGGVGPEISPAVAPVAGTKILLRRSGVEGKLPTAGDADYGELFINYHSGDPMLCFKDNSDNIVEIKPPRSIDGGGGELPPDTGNQVGDLIWDGTHLRVWDGTTWLAVGPGSLAYIQKADMGTVTNTAGTGFDIPLVNNLQAGLMAPGDKNKLDAYPADPTASLVDLGYTPAIDKGTVTNTGGTNAEIPVVGTNAGLMTPDDKNKLDTYPADAADLKVDLGYTAAIDKGTVTNTNGDDAELPLVDSSNAGLMAPGDKDKLDGYPATPDDLKVDLGYTAAADKGTVTNTSGDDAELPLVDSSNAGLMSPGDKGKLDGYPATPDDLAATLTLQAVTDNGNTTTNGATFCSGKISLNTDGSIDSKNALSIKGAEPRVNFEADTNNIGMTTGFAFNQLGTREAGVFYRSDITELQMKSGSNKTGGSISFGVNDGVEAMRLEADGSLILIGGGIASNPLINLERSGTVKAVDFKYTGGSAPSPALVGKEIDLVKTIELMAAKLAELGGVDIASLFVAEDPAPFTQPADTADDEDA